MAMVDGENDHSHEVIAEGFCDLGFDVDLGPPSAVSSLAPITPQE